MTTIGYGDITPQSLIEKKFVTLITVLSCGMFAYSINSIGRTFYSQIKEIFLERCSKKVTNLEQTWIV